MSKKRDNKISYRMVSKSNKSYLIKNRLNYDYYITSIDDNIDAFDSIQRFKRPRVFCSFTSRGKDSKIISIKFYNFIVNTNTMGMLILKIVARCITIINDSNFEKIEKLLSIIDDLLKLFTIEISEAQMFVFCVLWLKSKNQQIDKDKGYAEVKKLYKLNKDKYVFKMTKSIYNQIIDFLKKIKSIKIKENIIYLIEKIDKKCLIFQ